MSLKILLADDNITAQRLGSKILTDAGHAVIAVSNGAAAVKKIAADKPDLLILDVYMPGYSGLEVCEKVKNDPATAQVPVILTVTNMEPFNAADGNRVRSDGLMIKPFEASDLLAVVQKFEAKAKPKEPEYAHTMKMAAVEEFKDASYEEWKAAEPEEETNKIEVPHDMAAAPALGFDEPAPQPVHMEEAAPMAAFHEPAPAIEEPPPTAAFEIPAAAPAFDAPPAFGVEEHVPSFGLEHPAPSFDQHASFDLNAPVADHSAPIDAHAELMTPVTEHHEAIDVHAALSHPTEFEATSAAPVEVHSTQAAELESTSVTTPEVAIAQDPALVTDADEMSQFATTVGEAHPEENPITVGVALPGLTVEEEAPAEERAPVAETHEDTYATTIKMKAYSEPEPEPSAAPEPIAEPSPVEDEMQRAFAAGSNGAAAAPALAPEPQPEPVASEPAPIHDELVAQFAAELDQAHQEREAMGVVDAPPNAAEAAALEASMEIAKEIPASQLDEEKIAAAVSRALDRYKEGLRAELIQSIVRELKG